MVTYEQILKDHLIIAEYDKIDAEKKVYKYSAPMFDMVECDTSKQFRTGTTTSAENFYEWIENNIKNKYFDPLRDRDDFKKLVEKKQYMVKTSVACVPNF